MPVASVVVMDEPDLPQPPPALLDLLQRVEDRLNELDALREEVRTIREALKPPESHDAVVSPPALELILSFPPPTVRGESPGQGSGQGSLRWEGHGTGHAPPIDEPTREWLSNLQKRGGQAAKAADVITRVIYLAAKLGEVL